MGWIRRRWFESAVLATALLLVMVGVDAAPAQPADEAPAALGVATRAVTPTPSLADLPQENGQPVLPAEQDGPRVLRFVRGDPVRLIADADRVEQPGAVRRLTIPTIGLASEVVQVGLVSEGGNLRYETANFVVGQYRGVNPGSNGNVILAGHVSTRDGRGGSIFRNLHQLELGDTVIVATDRREIEYVVSEIRFVGANAVEVMEPAGREQLTLVTCRGCNTNCQRLVVIALPVERSADA